MLELLRKMSQIIGTETAQQQALTYIIFGAVGLALLIIIIKLVSKVKAVAFFGG